MARKKINWSAQPLGKMSDVDLARKLDVPLFEVCTARRKRKIRKYGYSREIRDAPCFKECVMLPKIDPEQPPKDPVIDVEKVNVVEDDEGLFWSPPGMARLRRRPEKTNRICRKCRRPFYTNLPWVDTCLECGRDQL